MAYTLFSSFLFTKVLNIASISTAHFERPWLEDVLRYIAIKTHTKSSFREQIKNLDKFENFRGEIIIYLKYKWMRIKISDKLKSYLWISPLCPLLNEDIDDPQCKSNGLLSMKTKGTTLEKHERHCVHYEVKLIHKMH